MVWFRIVRLWYHPQRALNKKTTLMHLAHWTMQDAFIVRRHTSKFEGKNPNYNPFRSLYKWPLRLCFVNLTSFELSLSKCMYITKKPTYKNQRQQLLHQSIRSCLKFRYVQFIICLLCDCCNT
jgi:hypothetical protein